MVKIELAHTKTIDDITMAVSFAEAAGDISLIYGEAGLGKTYALKEYAKTHTDAVYIELMDCDRSTKGVCEMILTALGKEQTGVDRCLVKTIIESLQKSPKLLLIDEAQHLSVKALENLRAINDVTETGIVLCGNPTVYDRMHGRGQAHFAQLYSRIGIKRHVADPTIDDIICIFNQFGLDKESMLFLHKLSLQRGGIRNCVKVLNIALTINGNSKEPLCIDHLITAYKLRNGEQ